jgi:hypothetical protein
VPVLVESRQIEIEFADLDRLVSQKRVYEGPRSNGVHLSGVIKCVLEAGGLLTSDDRGDMMPLCMCVGMAWEAWIVQLWPDLVWQPGEYCQDGVYGSPDGYTGHVLEEVKATYMSRLEKSETKGVRPEPKNILNIKRWMMQLAGYCKMMGLLEARLHVLWIMGDYRGSGPQYFTYYIQFTQAEIDRLWNNMILPNIAYATAEAH